nr:hypothetical protein [uncultured bacterium]
MLRSCRSAAGHVVRRRPELSRMNQVGTAAQPVTGLRRVLTVLCITEITSWGVLYYAFPVLAPTISAHTGVVTIRSRWLVCFISRRSPR